MVNNDFEIENGVLVEYLGDGGEVVIPDGVTSIADYVFNDEERITSVVIPDSVTHIGIGAFSGCENITAIKIPKDITIGSGAFSGCYGLMDAKGFVIVNGDLFDYDVRDSKAIIPETVSVIRSGTFVYFEDLEEVVVPATVKSINDVAFDLCENFKKITFLGSDTFIAKDAFYGYSGLTICAPVGSTAEQYAKENNMKFVAE